MSRGLKVGPRVNATAVCPNPLPNHNLIPILNYNPKLSLTVNRSSEPQLKPQLSQFVTTNVTQTTETKTIYITNLHNCQLFNELQQK